MHARLLPLPPDPCALAGRLLGAELPGVCLLESSEGPSYVAAAPDDHASALDPHREPVAEGELAAAPRWIGVIPYEARRGLERPRWSRPDTRPAPSVAEPSWLRYPAVLRVEGGDVMAIGTSASAVERLARAASGADLRGPARLSLLAPPPARDHLARVARARELILAGDLYQVNLARRFELRAAGHALDVYRALRGRVAPRFGAVIPAGAATVVALSPELLLRASARDGQLTWLRTDPIKGTRPRGHDASSDAALAAELERDPKERAELAMILDVERGDLSRVCLPGSVRLLQPPRVHTHATVHHREASLGGLVRPGVSRAEVLEAMVPSGSVTGAPKVRAMEVIAELEDHRRGVYTGAFGHISHAGSLELGMAIRTLVLEGERGHYFAGGGIVADSDPERELRETEWKARRLFDLAQ